MTPRSGSSTTSGPRPAATSTSGSPARWSTSAAGWSSGSADDQGLDLSLVTDFSYPGHSAPRCHTVPDRSGRRLLDGLVRRVRREERIDLMVPATLVEVLTDDGKVVGRGGRDTQRP